MSFPRLSSGKITELVALVEVITKYGCIGQNGTYPPPPTPTTISIIIATKYYEGRKLFHVRSFLNKHFPKLTHVQRAELVGACYKQVLENVHAGKHFSGAGDAPTLLKPYVK